MADSLVGVGGQFTEEQQMFWSVGDRHPCDGVATQARLGFLVRGYKGQESLGFRGASGDGVTNGLAGEIRVSDCDEFTHHSHRQELRRLRHEAERVTA